LPPRIIAGQGDTRLVGVNGALAGLGGSVIDLRYHTSQAVGLLVGIELVLEQSHELLSHGLACFCMCGVVISGFACRGREGGLQRAKGVENLPLRGQESDTLNLSPSWWLQQMFCSVKSCLIRLIWSA
jgi:hypothetical protein